LRLLWTSLPVKTDELRFFRYEACGGFRPLSIDGLSGDLGGLELPLEDDSVIGYDCFGRGERVVGMSPSGSTRSSENAFGGMAFGGSAGNDFSGTMGELSLSRAAFACAAAFDFFRRRAMSDS